MRLRTGSLLLLCLSLTAHASGDSAAFEGVAEYLLRGTEAGASIVNRIAGIEASHVTEEGYRSFIEHLNTPHASPLRSELKQELSRIQRSFEKYREAQGKPADMESFSEADRAFLEQGSKSLRSHSIERLMSEQLAFFEELPHSSSPGSGSYSANARSFLRGGGPAPMVRPDLMPSVTQLFEGGPNRWINLPRRPTGAYLYQRGLSGDFSGTAGVQEAMDLLAGKADTLDRHVSLLLKAEDTHLVASEVSSLYSSPLTVRGRMPKPIHVVNPPDPAIPGSGTGLLPAGNTVDSVEAIGIFPPQEAGSSKLYSWSSNYLDMRSKLIAAGMKATPGSRGSQFADSLQSALDGARFGAPDPQWGVRAIENLTEVGAGLREVFVRFR